MTAKETLQNLVNKAKALQPDISISFSVGLIEIRGRHVYKESYITKGENAEEMACQRMLFNIFILFLSNKS